MTQEVKKTRTPRNYESIESGALKLPLQERVDLRKKLDESIKAEVEDLKEKAAIAAKISSANGVS